MITRRNLIGGAMAGRLIDPVNDIERAANEQHGVATTRSIVRGLAEQERFTADPSRNQKLILFETMSRYATDVPSNTDTIMGDIMIDTGSLVTLMTITDDVPMQCRIVALRIKSTVNVSAGTLTPVVRIYEDGSPYDYPFDTCALYTPGHTRKNSVVFPWESALQVSKGAAWQIIARTDASFTATTADIKVELTFAYEDWI